MTLLLISCDEMADADAWRPFEPNLRNSTVGAAVAAVGAFLGNVLGGPIGGLVGGLAGVAVGALTEENDVESFPGTIANMTPRQRQGLAQAIRNSFHELLQQAARVCRNR